MLQRRILACFCPLQALQDLTRQHTDSFNFMVEEGLSYAVQVWYAFVATIRKL